MLFEHFYKKCKRVNPSRVADGEGGYSVTWTEGTTTFDAAIVHDSSTQARVAESAGVTDLYTITTKTALNFHDVIKDSDGLVYRITSNAKVTPDSASFAFKQYSAERWVTT